MERDHGTVPPSLSNRSGLRFRFSRSVVEDDRELIRPDEARIGTEDGVSKSFEMLSSKAMEHYIQPTDGAPLCFVAPCSANSMPSSGRALRNSASNSPAMRS